MRSQEAARFSLVPVAEPYIPDKKKRVSRADAPRLSRALSLAPEQKEARQQS